VFLNSIIIAARVYKLRYPVVQPDFSRGAWA